MAEEDTSPPGPDLTKGFAAAELGQGSMILGHVGEKPVLLARVEGRIHAVSALCTHYQGPLAEGLLVSDTVRCPWHHARFCLKTGEAIGAPAFDPLELWSADERDGKIYVAEAGEPPAVISTEPASDRLARGRPGPRRIVVVGGGAAGFAAAERLRRGGYDGALTLLSAEADLPCDRPNLSKDYLAGKAPADWIPLRGRDFYDAAGIDVRTGVEVARLDLRDRGADLATGERIEFDSLVLGTGAQPIRPTLPGFDHGLVHVLRSQEDCEAIIRAAEGARRAVVVGASFIGLEVAAALITRDLEVHVAAHDTVPLGKVLGEGLGRFIRSLHESKGVVFHLGQGVAAFENGAVVLDDGTALPADLVVVGAGVKPRIKLAEEAGLAVDNGVVVDTRLETGVPGVFAVGDIARYPDRYARALIRVEHWAAAERQGQHVAKVILGEADAFADLPFFWSAHYDEAIHYVGHAQSFDKEQVDGDIGAYDATVRYRSGGRLLAAATLGRDLEALKIELEMEGEGP
jgi:NADPH-dependent 2,4-dienoyl-CoA reductase/sulfur reductase-like enzyme/nitrite reductase/ring-hydroxylating ferredoxin subunit